MGSIKEDLKGERNASREGHHSPLWRDFNKFGVGESSLPFNREFPGWWRHFSNY
jgi:hypothetical protein